MDTVDKDKEDVDSDHPSSNKAASRDISTCGDDDHSPDSRSSNDETSITYDDEVVLRKIARDLQEREYDRMMNIHQPFLHCPPFVAEYTRALGERFLQDMRVTCNNNLINPIVPTAVKRDLYKYCAIFTGNHFAFNYAVHMLDYYAFNRGSAHGPDAEGPMFACIVIATKITRSFDDLDMDMLIRTYHLIKHRDHRSADYSPIRDLEQRVMRTAQFVVPTVAERTDLEMLNYMLMRPLGFPANIEEYEITVVNYYLVHRNEVIERMVELHSRARPDWMEEFHLLMSNRYLVPCAAVYCIVRYTLQAVDMEVLREILCAISDLPGEYILRMASVLVETWQKFPWLEKSNCILAKLF